MHIFGLVPRRFMAFALYAATVTSLAAAICLAVPTIVAADKALEDDPIIGIALGSFYSRVAVYSKNGRVEIIADDQGQSAVPSYVALTEAGWLVGDDAKRQASANSENTVYGAMRFLGRRFSDSSVQEDIRQFPFRVVDRDGAPVFRISANGNEQDLTPEEATALVLGKLKAMAVKYLGQNVTKAIVEVPTHFNDSQRQAVKAAGQLVGLNIVRTMNEPSAAAFAIAYGLNKSIEEKNFLVYHLGDSSFDVFVLNIDNGIFEERTTDGDAHLGGKNFDDRLTEHLIGICESKFGKRCANDVKLISDLRREAEVVGLALLSEPLARVELESFFDGEDFSATVTRAKFEELNMDLFERTVEVVRKTLRDAGLSKNQIDEIVLVGSSTRIPKVVQLLEDYFDGKKALSFISPEETIVYGAALQASFLMAEDVDSQVVCALLAPTVLLSLGIETAGGVMTKLLLRKSLIPTKETRVFTTATDNQSTVLIQVYKGERALTRHNRLLGTLELTDIPPAARGVPRIEVTFEHDMKAILNVSAVDLGTGKSASMSVDCGLMTDEEFELIVKAADWYKEEIEKFVKEAEWFEEEDQLDKEAIAARVAFEFFLQPQEDVMEVDADEVAKQAFRAAVVEVTVGGEENMPEPSSNNILDKQLISVEAIATIEESEEL